LYFVWLKKKDSTKNAAIRHINIKILNNDLKSWNITPMQTTKKINTKTTKDAWVDHKHSTQSSNKT
jgi:hypothetical protein